MRVMVLLSTFNGEKYLREQIESLTQQVGVEISILVRDDGSTDQTTSILDFYQNSGVLSWYSGENFKPAFSFLDLVMRAPMVDFYAYCDQDDYWDKCKLLAAVESILNIDDSIPGMYFSKATLVNEDLNEIANVNYPTQSFTFGQALLRNNVTGCTIVFNNSLYKVLRKHIPRYIIMHDHWTYLLCLAVGGIVVFDSNSYIKYRQHSSNAIGGRTGLIDVFKNSSLFKLKGLRWNVAVELYVNFHDEITKENLALLSLIVNYKESSKSKMKLILDRDFKNQMFLQDVLLVLNIILNRF